MRCRKKAAFWNARALAASVAVLAGLGVTATVVVVSFRPGGGIDVSGGAPQGATSTSLAATKPIGSGEGRVRATREVIDRAASRSGAARQLARMPMVFVENDGQWPADVKLAARGHGLSAAFTDRGMTLSAPAKDEKGKDSVQAVSFEFVRDGDGCKPKGERRIAGVHNYFLGNDPSKWHAGVQLFEAVRYDEVAPGVAMVVTDRDGKLEYDLHVEPGADLSAVNVTCKGAEALSIEEDGSLRIDTAAGAAVQSLPKAWYELANGEQKIASCRFKMTGPTSYGFDVRDRDPAAKLVVDPTVGLNWCTFLGTSSDEEIHGVALLSGLVTVVGATKGSGFPTTSGVYQTSLGGGQDAFITRFDPSQSGSSQLVWSTFLGGSNDDIALGMDLTSSGHVALCGKTRSTDFPTSSGAHAGSPMAALVDNAFVSYLTSNGQTLYYSTYYGSTNGMCRANAIKIDSTPFLTIVGYVEGSGLHRQGDYDSGYDGNGDAFAARFDPSVSGSGSLVYGTYIGSGFGGFSASSYDEAFAVDIDGIYIYVAGSTSSSGFHTQYKPPYTVVYQTIIGGGRDCFLMKLDPSKTGSNQLRYATFVGGNEYDEAYGLDAYADVFHACGYTNSGNYPTGSTESYLGIIYQSGIGGGKDAFLTKLDPSGSNSSNQLIYSTYLGGGSDDVAYAIQRQADMADVLDGYTESSGFPTGDFSGGTPYQTSYGGSRDMFLTRLAWYPGRHSNTDHLDYSTYLGDTDLDDARALVFDASSVFFAGWTKSSNFPTAGSPYDSTYNGGSATGDGVVGQFTMPALAVSY